MRKIVFRGRDAQGIWWYGSLVHLHVSNTYHIIPCGSYKPHVGAFTIDQVEVDPSTIGQFTGMRDKEGNAIFEGDVLKVGKGAPLWVVTWGDGRWENQFMCGLFESKVSHCTIIGNAYDQNKSNQYENEED